MADFFDHLLGLAAVRTDDAVVVDALCDTEAALARACARSGLVPMSIADAIVNACDEQREADPGDLARQAVRGGNPVIPLVAELRRRVGERHGDRAARAVHFGATSQDILDTALMLVAKQATTVLVARLGECAEAIALLARDHRDTAMCGRTLLQQAVPTTFGAVAAGWGVAVDRDCARVEAVRRALPAQLGGAVGTLTPFGSRAFDVLSAFADELGLADPGRGWHTDRAPITELASALGATSATVRKVATDLVLLAQDEVGEVRERQGGGSSAMAHKHNPIGAVTARAAAMQVPGLVATLLSAASPELQRGAGAWHAEWPALLSLLRFSAGAADRLRAALDITVNVDAMARNLSMLDGVADTADVGVAPALVDRYLAGRA